MYSTSVSVYGCISVKGICKWKWKLKCVDVYMACWKCKRLHPITIRLFEGVMWHTDRLWGTSGTQMSLWQSCMLFCTIHSQLFIHCLSTTLNIWAYTLNVWTYPSNIWANSCIPTKESSLLLCHMWRLPFLTSDTSFKSTILLPLHIPSLTALQAFQLFMTTHHYII